MNAVPELRNMPTSQMKLGDSNRVSFGELYTREFLKKYTTFKTINEMFEASGFVVTSNEDFEARDRSKWDQFIAAKTRFADWEDMTQAACREWILRKFA